MEAGGRSILAGAGVGLVHDGVGGPARQVARSIRGRAARRRWRLIFGSGSDVSGRRCTVPSRSVACPALRSGPWRPPCGGAGLQALRFSGGCGFHGRTKVQTPHYSCVAGRGNVRTRTSGQSAGRWCLDLFGGLQRSLRATIRALVIPRGLPDRFPRGIASP